MKAFAILALVPLAIGSPPSEERTLTVGLCSGGEITIPIGDKEDKNDRDCQQTACHAGTCREKNRPTKA